LDPTPQDFQRFSLFVLSTIRDNLAQFDESSRIAPGGQPYDEKYFIESEKYVRRTARRMNDALEQQQRQTIPTKIYHKNEDIKSYAGAQSNMNDGKQPTTPSAGRERHRHYAELFACKEAGCDRHFRGLENLKQHQKARNHQDTHTRPWKCPVPTCRYHEHGWPTEKERDRHVADKHSSESAAGFKCHFKPCTYISKRESNCKQHMEKFHGWTYVRSKKNGKKVTEEARNVDVVEKMTDEAKKK
jgi:hypothetical protein